MRCAATAMYRYMFEQTHFASQPSSTVTMKSRRLADMAATDMESKVENTGESMIRLRKAAGITVNRNYVENNSSHNPNSPATARNRPQGRNGLTGTETTPDQVRTYRKSAIIQPTYTYTCIYIFFFERWHVYTGGLPVWIVYPGVHPAPVQPAVATPPTPQGQLGLVGTTATPT